MCWLTVFRPAHEIMQYVIWRWLSAQLFGVLILRFKCTPTRWLGLNSHFAHVRVYTTALFVWIYICFVVAVHPLSVILVNFILHTTNISSIWSTIADIDHSRNASNAFFWRFQMLSLISLIQKNAVQSGSITALFIPTKLTWRYTECDYVWINLPSSASLEQHKLNTPSQDTTAMIICIVSSPAL